MNVSEAASGVEKQVYHTSQGQDERAEAQPLCRHHRLPLHGLDSAWSGDSNPHRESGTRWRAAADVGQADATEGKAHGRQKGRDGNRLGDSVGAHTLGTGEGSRSAASSQRDTTGKRDLASGDVLAGSMRKPRGFKRRGLVASVAHPHAIDDAHPDVGQGSHRHTVSLAFGTFAPIIVQRPGFLSCRLPGKLIQGIAQRFGARQAFVSFGISAALERHGRGSGQSLDAVGIGVTRSILAPFGQQTWRQALAGTGKRTPHLLVVMGQKKGADGRIIVGDLLDHHQQLLDQREHQALLGTHGDRSGDQLGAVQFLKDLGCSPARIGMLARAQRRRDLFHRGGLSRLGRGVRLQKHERGALLHFGKQVQGRRVVLLEASRQLVDQARLRLDQCILITGERFQLLHDGAIWGQSAQLAQVKTTHLGQQVRVNLISLGSCRFAQLIGGLGVHRIHGDASLQQERDQQSVVRFDDTRQLFGLRSDAQHKLFQLVQAVVAVGKSPRSDALAGFIQHLYVMMGICPIQSNVPHPSSSLSRATPGDVGSFYTGCSKHVPPIIDWPRKTAKGSTIFLRRSRRVEVIVFPRQFLQGKAYPCRSSVEWT